MCFFRLEITPLSRSQNRNAIAAAAYRAGQRLVDDCDYSSKTRKVFDYRRRGGVVATGVILPEHTPSCFYDRQTLWTAAEKAETRKNSRVAREALISLPHELTDKQRQEAVERFCKHLVGRYGAGVDYAIHRPHKDSDSRNHHAHVLFTTRAFTHEGLGAKIRALDDKEQGKAEINHMRSVWEKIGNNALQQANRPERINKKSLEAQNINKLPEPKQGAIATSKQRKQQHSYAGADRQAVKAYNRIIQRYPRSERAKYIQQAKYALRASRKANRPIAGWLQRNTAALKRRLQQRQGDSFLQKRWRQIAAYKNTPTITLKNQWPSSRKHTGQTSSVTGYQLE